MPFKAGDVVRSLRTKGFREDRKRDHVYLHHYYNGRLTGVHTKVSHGSGGEEIGHELVRRMKLQLKLLSPAEVIELVECPMTEERYVSLLKQRGVIPPNR